MLVIRLARAGKHKSPFYRVVLTEHTKPAQVGYQAVLGWFDPLHHTHEINVEAVNMWISKGAQPSDRVAKILLKATNDESYRKFILYRHFFL
jgi:small subunit ribosomal protein S16